ncbi:MAG TPA: hypothetical protein VF702_12325 [Allosphingosinicella sp.]|jgi:hypothetical protein
MDHEKGNGRAADADREARAGVSENEASGAGGVGDDPGAPGGMGGVRGGMPNPDNRPNGGVSPIREDGDGRRE